MRKQVISYLILIGLSAYAAQSQAADDVSGNHAVGTMQIADMSSTGTSTGTTTSTSTTQSTAPNSGSSSSMSTNGAGGEPAVASSPAPELNEPEMTPLPMQTSSSAGPNAMASPSNGY